MNTQKQALNVSPAEGLIGLATSGGFVGIIWYWGWLAVFFLQKGHFPNPNAIVYLMLKENIVIDWLIAPQSWIGVQKIIMPFLSVFGPGLVVLLAGLLGMYIRGSIIEAAREIAREKAREKLKAPIDE